MNKFVIDCNNSFIINDTLIMIDKIMYVDKIVLEDEDCVVIYIGVQHNNENTLAFKYNNQEIGNQVFKEITNIIRNY